LPFSKLFNQKKFLPYLDQKIAVAVSGGADSLALVVFLWQLVNKDPLRLQALIVDHNLRENSNIEAEQVKRQLLNLGIPTLVLFWSHQGIQSKIQETARFYRYQLLIDYCKKNKISSLWLGHHSCDQFETVMMRLSHASGLKGLGGIRNLSFREGIGICRPFLSLHPSQLQEYLLSQKLSWVNDPSNTDNKFERIRWRSKTLILNEAGLSLSSINSIASKLQDEEDALDWAVQKWMDQHTEWDNKYKFITIASEIRNLPKAFLKRAMLKIAESVRCVPIWAKDIRNGAESSCQKVYNLPFVNFTFGGCYWASWKDKLVCVREWGKISEIQVQSTSFLYDNRFVLKDCEVGALVSPWGKRRPLEENAHLNIPKTALYSLPSIANKLIINTE
jgi:tRNA(Ile)-lysidine synthetase-like protein